MEIYLEFTFIYILVISVYLLQESNFLTLRSTFNIEYFKSAHMADFHFHQSNFLTQHLHFWSLTFGHISQY